MKEPRSGSRARLHATCRFAVLSASALVALSHGGVASASCSFGTPFGGEPTLQNVFDDLFGAGAAPNSADCIADPGDALWAIAGNGGSATILVEIAGFRDGNSLGFYDPSSINPQSPSGADLLQIYPGPAGPGARAAVTVTPNGAVYDFAYTLYNESNQRIGSGSASFGSSVFGIYVATPQGNRFYSDSSLRPERSDYMYTYRGSGATFLPSGNGSHGTSRYVPAGVSGAFDLSSAIVAWEDLRLDLGAADNDHQDMVVLMRDIVPVPVPAAAWLLGSALTMLGAGFRRRRPAH